RPAQAQVLERYGSLFGALGHRPPLVRHGVELGGDTAQPLGDGCDRFTMGDRGQRPTEAIAGAALTAQALDGLLARLSMGEGVGEQRLLDLEPGVLALVLDRRRVELSDLEPEQVDLTRSGPLVAA